MLINSEARSNAPHIDIAASKAWNGFITITNPSINVIIDNISIGCQWLELLLRIFSANCKDVILFITIHTPITSGNILFINVGLKINTSPANKQSIPITNWKLKNSISLLFEKYDTVCVIP